MKRLLSLVLVLLVASASAALASEAQPYAGKTLTLMLDAGDSGSANLVKSLEHCAERMGITLEYDSYPADQYLTVVNTKLTTGNGGDLLYGNKGLGMLYADALASLSGDWIEKITDISRAFCIDEAGNYKVAPVGSESNMGLVYNQNVLDASGVELPITNYADFLTACEKIKAAGFTPLYISNKEQWTAQILILCSITPIFDAHPEYVEQLTTNKIKPSEIPEIVELFERVVALRDLGYINEDYMSATDSMGVEALVMGDCAFYACTDSTYGTLETDYPESLEYLGMTCCPMWEDESMAMIMTNKSISYFYVVDNENKEISEAFINTLLSEECLTYHYELNPGKVPYDNLGFDCRMSGFNQNMVDLHEQSGIPYNAQWNDKIYEANGYAFQSFWGLFETCVQKMFAGMSVTEALDTWYNNYAADAQAMRLEGWA